MEGDESRPRRRRAHRWLLLLLWAGPSLSWHGYHPFTPITPAHGLARRCSARSWRVWPPAVPLSSHPEAYQDRERANASREEQEEKGDGLLPQRGRLILAIRSPSRNTYGFVPPHDEWDLPLEEIRCALHGRPSPTFTPLQLRGWPATATPLLWQVEGAEVEELAEVVGRSVLSWGLFEEVRLLPRHQHRQTGPNGSADKDHVELEVAEASGVLLGLSPSTTWR